MKCPKCSVESEGNFCSNCGASLESSNVATMEPQPTTIQGPPVKPPTKHKALKIGCGCLLIVFGLLFAIGLVGSLFFAASRDSSPTLSKFNETTNDTKSVSTTAVPVPTAAAIKPSIDLVTATVLRVVDGDTIDVSVSKKTYRVRLIGVDTPETKDPRKSVQYFGKEASDYTTKSLSKRIVYLEYDTQSKDKYGRILAYVWLSQPEKTDDINIRAKMFNTDLLLSGYAQIMTVPPNVKYVDYFKDYQKEARTKAVGMWTEAPTTTTVRLTTTTTERPDPTTTTTKKTSITPPSTSGDVTVYITRTGEKYHSYGCRYLRQSCIPVSLSDAIAQGYEPCSVCDPPTN